MFHWGRVNRLTRANTETCVRLRTAGAATGGREEVFAGRVSPNGASETRPTRLNVRSTCSNHNTYIYFSVPPPPTQYRRAILYDTYIIYTLIGGKPVISLFIYPLSKSLLSTRLLRPFIHPPLLFNNLDLLHIVYCFPLYYKRFKLRP